LVLIVRIYHGAGQQNITFVRNLVRRKNMKNGEGDIKITA
jgi:hypothetical protein